VTIHQLISAFEKHQLALNTSRWARAKAEARAAEVAEAEQFGWDQSPGHRGAGCPEDELWIKESVCFPFEYDGPDFEGPGCKSCCPQIDIPVTPKPDNVSPSSWWGYFNTHG